MRTGVDIIFKIIKQPISANPSMFEVYFSRAYERTGCIILFPFALYSFSKP
jgi:hypothetical protein